MLKSQHYVAPEARLPQCAPTERVFNLNLRSVMRLWCLWELVIKWPDRPGPENIIDWCGYHCGHLLWWAQPTHSKPRILHRSLSRVSARNVNTQWIITCTFYPMFSTVVYIYLSIHSTTVFSNLNWIVFNCENMSGRPGVKSIGDISIANWWQARVGAGGRWSPGWRYAACARHRACWDCLHSPRPLRRAGSGGGGGH